MKKLFLVGAVALFGAVNAQEYKPGTGDVTTEFGLKGGLGDTKVELPGSNAYFKARYFKTDNIAYRATLSLGTTSNTKDVDSYSAEGTDLEKHTTGKDKTSSTGFLLGFGLEKHFKGTERLSPYVGGEFLLGYNSQKVSSERTTVNSGANTTAYKGSSDSSTKGPNTFSFGVRGVFGADYYFTKRVFLGVEAGLSLMYGSEGKTTTTSSHTATSGGTTTSKSYTSELPGGSSFNITPSVVTGIRLGYAF
ncbi:hypothetical protein [Riemerella anatipestifer]|uniref:hypothetical protein n=1 Tax=Riemerella anatipestifer TaxID=34085 RepID=UPI00129D87C8|nr:hypothetical protein [Riemerella anatipestifer]MRM82585.1 hypothetical protein [Riemerella anatipestifer]